MSGFHNTALIGASGQGGAGYTIENSLRFRSSASAYLSRTPATAGNRKTWTWSGWVKRGTLSVNAQYLLGTPLNGATGFRFNSNNTFYFTGNGSTQFDFNTTQVFRDPSAWYHIIIAFDTTQATSSNRVKFYVNGVQITAFSTATYPSLNLDGQINAADVHRMSHVNNDAGANFDGYLAEINFVDGQALDPSSFGEYNEDTGVWQPVAYAGTYGTNGFYLPFSDATNTTTLVADSSGNGNDWTPNNISLTAGSTYDSMTDTPTPYADGGNYCVLNPLNTTNGAVAQGNLYWSSGGASGFLCTGSIAFDIADTVNKYYFEIQLAGGDGAIGIAPTTLRGSDTGRAGSYSYYTTGSKYSGVTASAYGAAFGAPNIIGVAVGAGKITFYKNGVSQGDAFTGLTGLFVPMLVEVSGTFNANFGQRPFAYTPPTGFLPLHTGNLPDSTIVDGSQYFDVVLYTAATADGTYTEGNLSFRPDFSWIKNRNNAERHFLSDVVRGNTSITDKFLVSDSTATEGANGVSGTTFSVTDTGYEFVETSINTGELFFNGRTYVAWNWKANGAGVSNTDGSITSTVSANQDAGFSIVTFTDAGSAGTVGHGLGVKPDLIIQKLTSVSSAWYVFTEVIDGSLDFLNLNTTGAKNNSTLSAPTSTVFSNLQISGGVVAYCFASVEGYSKFGSYTGNGSADGPFVYLGFRPKFVLVKRADSSGNWFIWDSSRDTYNTVLREIYPDSSSAEYTRTGSSDSLDFTSNGFKLRFSATYADRNANNGKYIYMAFAENPFKNSLAR